MNLDPQTWTIIFAALNTVIAVTAVVAALMAPRISARLTATTELRRAKRQEKLWVLTQVMQNRPQTESLESIRALNLIDVIYHDHKEIRRLWRELYDMLTNPAFFGETNVGLAGQLISQKKSALLVAMARDLEYDIETFDVDRIYAPRWLVEQERITLADRKSKLPIADYFLATGQLPGAGPAANATTSTQPQPQAQQPAVPQAAEQKPDVVKGAAKTPSLPRT